MQNAEARYTNPFDPRFYGTTIPNLRAGFLYVSGRARPRELKRKFHPGFFVKILYDLLRYDHGEPDIERDEWGNETHRTWTLTVEELAQRWADITKHRITTYRHRVAKAFDYLWHLGRMDLLHLEAIEGAEERYRVRFPDLVQWTGQKQQELINDGTLKRSDRKKLNRLHWFGNGCSWDWLLPNRHRIKIYVKGSLRSLKSVPACARTYATQTYKIATQHVRAILGGACDYHVQSERPARRRALRQKRKTIKYLYPAQKTKAIAAMKEEIRQAIEETAPTFRTWPISNATGAEFQGHSPSTEKRRLHSRDIINIVPQALVMGPPVTGREIRQIVMIRERYGAQPFRFIPVPGQRGWYQPQLDVPNRIEYKRQFQNWALYPNIPAELYCRPDQNEKTPMECMELTVPQVTTHYSRYGRENGKSDFLVLAPSLVRLAYLGDEGSPEMQAELEKAGLKMWKGPFRKKKRVAVRGCHHKDRTRKKKQMQEAGTWKGTLPMEVMVPTQNDINRREAPQTIYRRELRERAAASKAEIKRVGSLYLNDFVGMRGRIDNGPHRGYKLSTPYRSRSNSPPWSLPYG